MRILIVLPRQERATGNEVTAGRHAQGLTLLGHQVILARVSLGDSAALQRVAEQFSPDIIHLLHAYRSGRPWLEAALNRGPSVVTLTGTDINGGIEDIEEGPVIRRVLSDAGKIITQNRLTAMQLHQDFPHHAAKIAYLSPGVVLGAEDSPWSRSALALPESPLFLHPAGIRPVKGNLELLDLFDPLAAADLPFTLAFCGPPLDPSYSRTFFVAVAQRPWAQYLGIIPPAAMSATLRQADVILNNSQSEGIANVLLEAATLGVPILARDIPGNADVVEPGVNGLLYEGADSFSAQVQALCDPLLRQRLSSPDPWRYSPERESQSLLSLYSQLLRGDKGAGRALCDANETDY